MPYYNGKYYSGIPRNKRQRKRCGAKLRGKDRYCRNWAMANGRCRLHGGKNKGPKRGTKNALKTGEFESIWYDTLTDEEKLRIQEIKLDVESQLNEEIKLITIRERRMMQRIRMLSDNEEGFTVTEINEDIEVGFGNKGAIDLRKTNRKSEAVLGQIQAIEEALTRIQDKKARLLELKHRVQSTDEEDAGALDELVAIYRQSKKRLARISGKSVEEVYEDDEEQKD